MANDGVNFNLRLYRDVLWRRKRVVLACFLVSTAVGSYFAMTSTPQYKVRATVMLREITLEFGTLKRMAPNVNATEDLGLLKAKLLSQATLAELIEKTGLRNDTSLEARAHKMQKSYPQMSREEIKNTLLNTELREKILRVIPDDNLIHFEATYHDPEKAYRIVQALVDIFISHARQLESSGLESGLRYSSAQLEVYRKRLEAKEAELQRLRSGSALSRLKSQPLDDARAENLRTTALATLSQLELVQSSLREAESKLSPDAASVSAKGRGNVDKLFSQQLDKLAQLTKLLKSNSTSAEQVFVINNDLKNAADALEAEIKHLSVLVPPGDREVWTEREIARLRSDFLERKKRALDGLLKAYAASREEALLREPSRVIAEERLVAEVQQAQQLYEMFLQQKQGTEMEAALKQEQSPYLNRVINPPELPLSPVGMRAGTKLLLGCLIGLGLGLTLAFALETLDRSFKSVEEVESFAKLPVVGYIPKLQQPAASFHWEMKDALEIQRITAYLTEQLAGAHEGNGFHTNGAATQATVLITSSLAGEGKSTFAAYLASSISLLKHHPVLLIDADLRRPQQHRLFKVENQKGLANLIENHGNAVQSHLIPTEYRRLFLLPSGHTQLSPLELFSGPAFPALLKQLKDYFNYIVIDAPPTVPVNDALMLCKHVNAMLYVLMAGDTEREVFKRGLGLVRSSGAPAPGIIINNFKDVLPYYYRPQHYKYEYTPVAVE